jgi:ArsR family transcriptional regulator
MDLIQYQYRLIFVDNYMNFDCCKIKKSKTKLGEVVDFLKLISEENRLKILCLLKEGEKCVCEIWQCLKLPQNLISHHLKILKDSGLIGSRKEGTKVFYKLNQKVVKKHIKLLNKFLSLKV